ncbi:hypothetical protein [Streptomyces aureoverticillatus]|uniref:hypothetical protein n=1 Tax=Streptomyces aureoverticillatus TaxID=66871 RepID=UPI0013DA1AEC|nr:hypothetical protein [Streptomyces aureoverticillatus]QIB41686.1 hypothetical protein G3H79_12825 [Streptomyces aureoverticillatus]
MSATDGAAPPPESAPTSAWGAAAGPGNESPWAAAAARPAGGERVTKRQRRVVEGLPDWEPLPPGETLVRRHGDHSP